MYSTILDYDKMKPGDTALIAAIRIADYDKITDLLKKNVRVNEHARWGNTALHYAYNYGDVRAIVLLLEHGANPNLLHTYGKKPKKYSEMARKTHEAYREEIRAAKKTYKRSQRTGVFSILHEMVNGIYPK